MDNAKIVLVLGDQLSRKLASLTDLEKSRDKVVMAEVADEASYVPHSRHKIALIFSAMRHFRDALEAEGITVIYFEYQDGIKSLADALSRASKDHDIHAVSCCEPGEYRVQQHLEKWANDSGADFNWLEDDRFLCSIDAFKGWASGRKQLRMEHFYRIMRRDHNLLLDNDGGPEGEKCAGAKRLP